MVTQMYSQNIIAKMIQQHVGSAYSGGDIYNQLREMVDSGVLENEGVFIVSQETKQGSYGKAYSFDNCERVIEIWSQLYAKDDATADALLLEIKDATDKNKQFRNYFPNYLFRKLLKYLADKK